jgi:hypothetical protein
MFDRLRALRAGRRAGCSGKTRAKIGEIWLCLSENSGQCTQRPQYSYSQNLVILRTTSASLNNTTYS